MAILTTFMLLLVTLLSISSQISSETDTITQLQSLRDGRTLVSETFELGFFSPGSSSNRYLGIWFRNISVKTVVWVANRDHPISDKSGIVSISKEGNLVLLSKNKGTTQHWSTNVTTKTSSSSVTAQLLSTGNLVLRDEKENNNYNYQVYYYLWQSFDYPTDTLLPGMKLGWNLTSGLNRRLTAWKNWDDPSSGHLTFGFITSDVEEMEMWNGSSIMLFRSGPWNGIRFSGTPTTLNKVPLFRFDFTYNKDEYYFSYTLRDESFLSRVVINQTVYALQRTLWTQGNGNQASWKQHLSVPRDGCDNYNRCGSFGNCAMVEDSDSPTCECLSGFTPKSPQNWTAAKEWSQGCVRSKTWRCREKNKDGFSRYQNMKVPDTKKSWINTSMKLEECKARCWENCSCTAYANSDITEEGSGCILWFGDLLDLRHLPDSGQDLYVRQLPADVKDGSRKMVVVVTSTVAPVIVMLLVFTFCCWRRKTKSRGK